LGIEIIQLLVFNRKTKSTPPEDFFRDTILKKFGAKEMVVGPKVAFGKNRAGRLPLLRRLGKKYGVRIRVVPRIGYGAGQVSSRRIRALLERGRAEEANRLLGYPYSVEGRVVHGQARGRRLGFPTANIHADPVKILPPGVFWVQVNGMDGLCNVGMRPTFTPHSHALHCEVFILRPKTGKLYGRKLRVVFLRRIRAEKRFSSPAALKRQITKDLALAKRWIHAGR
jgi:riboflavin kinase/FMN adenylyltransferase